MRQREERTKIVSIDEACSGIRSLQAMLMIALFLGEFRSLNFIRWTALVGFAVCAAMVLNLARTLFVFFTLWEEANLDARSRAVSLDWSGWSRVQHAFARQRNLGQQSLEFILFGTEDYAEAVRMFKGRLPELVRCRDVE